MSSSISSCGQVDNAFNGERLGQDFSESLNGRENMHPETSFRRKLKRFCQRTRILSVVKKVVAGSKSLLNLFVPRQTTPRDSPPEPANFGVSNAAPRMEVVKFPEDMIPSPASSSSEASPIDCLRILPNANLGRSSLDTVPIALQPPPVHEVNVPVFGDHETASEIAYEKSFGDSRYKETLEKQKSFPEIKRGVVLSRVKLLEPIFSGERETDGDKNASHTGNETELGGPHNLNYAAPNALDIHASSGLAQTIDDGKVEKAPSSSEQDEESVFDYSPRLFRHRLPEEGPKPWVEPGIVARAALWLQPVMSGEKCMLGVDSKQIHLTSPTRVANGTFR